jgi:membrane protein implicated in regulation of membrane protease activity
MREIEVTNMSWGMRIAVALGMALALGLAAAFVVLALGLAVVLLPVVAVVLAVGWWRWRKIEGEARKARMREDAPGGFRVIETEYEVVSGPEGPHRG